MLLTKVYDMTKEVITKEKIKSELDRGRPVRVYNAKIYEIKE